MMAGPYIRVLLAWLLAMQPMLGAYAAAQAARAPLSAQLCRGVSIPGGEHPPGIVDHGACCLAACAAAAAPPPARFAVPAPASATANISFRRTPDSVHAAEARTSNRARAPPASFSTN